LQLALLGPVEGDVDAAVGYLLTHAAAAPGAPTVPLLDGTPHGDRAMATLTATYTALATAAAAASDGGTGGAIVGLPSQFPRFRLFARAVRLAGVELAAAAVEAADAGTAAEPPGAAADSALALALRAVLPFLPAGPVGASGEEAGDIARRVLRLRVGSDGGDTGVVVKDEGGMDVEASPSGSGSAGPLVTWLATDAAPLPADVHAALVLLTAAAGAAARGGRPGPWVEAATAAVVARARAEAAAAARVEATAAATAGTGRGGGVAPAAAVLIALDVILPPPSAAEPYHAWGDGAGALASLLLRSLALSSPPLARRVVHHALLACATPHDGRHRAVADALQHWTEAAASALGPRLGPHVAALYPSLPVTDAAALLRWSGEAPAAALAALAAATHATPSAASVRAAREPLLLFDCLLARRLPVLEAERAARSAVDNAVALDSSSLLHGGGHAFAAGYATFTGRVVADTRELRMLQVPSPSVCLTSSPPLLSLF